MSLSHSVGRSDSAIRCLIRGKKNIPARHREVAEQVRQLSEPRLPVFLRLGAPDDDIDGAGLILERDEGDAAGGGRRWRQVTMPVVRTGCPWRAPLTGAAVKTCVAVKRSRSSASGNVLFLADIRKSAG